MAPAMVIHSTAASNRSIMGIPVHLPVSSRSRRRSLAERPEPFSAAAQIRSASAERQPTVWSDNFSGERPLLSSSRLANVRARSRGTPPIPQAFSMASRRESSPSKSRRAAHLGKAASCSRRTGSITATARSAPGGQTAGAGVSREWRQACSTAAVRARSPSFFRAAVGITGSPSSFSSRRMWMTIPFFRASSIRFKQTIVRGHSSRICKTRFRLRASRVASQTTMQASGCWKQRKSRAISSSAEWAARE